MEGSSVDIKQRLRRCYVLVRLYPIRAVLKIAAMPLQTGKQRLSSDIGGAIWRPLDKAHGQFQSQSAAGILP
jgi:hypothetical protein